MSTSFFSIRDTIADGEELAAQRSVPSSIMNKKNTLDSPEKFGKGGKIKTFIPYSPLF